MDTNKFLVEQAKGNDFEGLSTDLLVRTCGHLRRCLAKVTCNDLGADIAEGISNIQAEINKRGN